MSGPTEEYVILQATLKTGEIKTVLVVLDEYDGEPSNYFARPVEAAKVGRVQIMGDTDRLDSSYTSD